MSSALGYLETSFLRRKTTTFTLNLPFINYAPSPQGPALPHCHASSGPPETFIEAFFFSSGEDEQTYTSSHKHAALKAAAKPEARHAMCVCVNQANPRDTTVLMRVCD